MIVGRLCHSILLEERVVVLSLDCFSKPRLSVLLFVWSKREPALEKRS